MARERDTTYKCETCGERHPRPEAFDLKDLTFEMRMIAFIHAVGGDAKAFIREGQS